MTKLLKKENYQFKEHSDYFYKALIFNFLDIGLFEHKEIKTNAFANFFSNQDIGKKDIIRIVELLKKDPVLLEMLQLWVQQETPFNLKFLESLYLKNLPAGGFILKRLKHLFINP